MAEEKLWIFDGSNFSNWKFRFQVLMEDRGLLDCLEDALIEEDYADLEGDTPEQKRTRRRLLAERVARDRRCKNLLINRIAEDQLEYVKDKRTAKDVWDALRDTFERVGIAGKLFLKKRFQDLRLAEGGDVKAFLLEFDKVLRELRAAGVKMETEDVVCQLLLALPKSFDALITAVETIQPKDLTLEYVKKRLLDEQVKRNSQDTEDEYRCPSESVFVSKRRVFKCFGCGRHGHKRADCPEERSVEGGEPEKNAITWSDETPIAFGVATGNAGVLSTPAVMGRQIEWFLDSGATDHMVRDKELFDELRPLARKVRISVAKTGQSLDAEWIGTIRVKMLVKGKWLLAVVHDVLYVPGLQSNLFSVRRIEDNGMTLKIAAGKVSIQKGRRIVGCGRRAGHLYALDVYRHGEASCNGSATAMTAWVPHEKVGKLDAKSKLRLDTRKKTVRVVESDLPDEAPTCGWKRMSRDEKSAGEGSAEKEFAAVVLNSGGVEEPVAGSSGDQRVTVKLTANEINEAGAHAYADAKVGYPSSTIDGHTRCSDRMLTLKLPKWTIKVKRCVGRIKEHLTLRKNSVCSFERGC